MPANALNWGRELRMVRTAANRKSGKESMMQFDERAHDAMLLRGTVLQHAPLEVALLLEAAFEEDDREGSRFDHDGWGNFFLEDWKKDPEVVEAAWREYSWYWTSKQQSEQQ
jgi:hypothetical protein